MNGKHDVETWLSCAVRGNCELMRKKQEKAEIFSSLKLQQPLQTFVVN